MSLFLYLVLIGSLPKTGHHKLFFTNFSLNPSFPNVKLSHVNSKKNGWNLTPSLTVLRFLIRLHHQVRYVKHFSYKLRTRIALVHITFSPVWVSYEAAFSWGVQFIFSILSKSQSECFLLLLGPFRFTLSCNVLNRPGTKPQWKRNQITIDDWRYM